MSMRSMRWWTGALAGVALGSLAMSPATAVAGTLYRWKTADGGIAFADDAKRIPERYRDKAEAVEAQGLSSYERFTPTDPAASKAHAEQLADRLESLRAAAGEATTAPGVQPGAVATHPLQGIALQSQRETVGRRKVETAEGTKWRRTTRLQTVDAPVPVLGVDSDAESNAPVIVEKIRAMPEGGMITRHVTIVRQGDRVLSVIKERSRESNSDWPREQDLEGARD